MKKYILWLLMTGLLLFGLTTCDRSSSGKNAEKTVAWDTLEELLAQMTLAEKVGQMTQAERTNLYEGDITQYALGSVLSGGGSSPAPNTPKGWVDMLNAFTEESLQTRLGIPVVYGLDAVHGHAIVENATILPHNVGLGAIAAGSLERGAQAAYTAGRITAEEMRATGVRWNFAPVLGVAEDVRWGRTYESFSENVEIVTVMGANVVRGLQDNGAAACMKHYVGEGQTINGRNQGNAPLDRAGIERILPPYRAAIDAGAMSLMPSFSSVNGIKMHEHKELLTDVLKGEMGFEGFVISDWAAVTQLSGGSYKAQLANAVNAGVDMFMATNGRGNWVACIQYLTELVNEGTVPMSRIDDAVLRILRAKQKMGLFDSPLTEKAGVIGSSANRAAARELVTESLVLLRNENNVIAKLPSYRKILVAGQGASDIGMQCGGWTITWQGFHDMVTDGTTILEGIQAAVEGRAAVTYAEDGRAEGAFDVVIAVIGEDPYAETQGDRFNNIDIRQRDADMLWEIYDYGCPVIVIMLSGRPMTIGDEYENWDAFIAAWLPGSEGGGIADALFGKRDFTGRTPYTWRKTINGEIVYPFGYGLTNIGQNTGDFEYTIENDIITITGYRGSEKNVNIPETINGLPVAVIGSGAFARNRLTSVTLPGTVTVIENRAFSYNSLTKLTMPDSLVMVDYMAFFHNRLTNIELPASITYIGINAFGANRLKNINLPDSLEYIGDRAFSKNLMNNITVPRSVRNFNSSAFDPYVKIIRR
jgi:beta-glucosidase